MFEDLHRLLQSLTPTEFQRVKHFISQQGGESDSQHKQLYNCLANMDDEYQDDQIEELKKKLYKNKDKEDALRVVSYKLFNKIMYVLRDPDLRTDMIWKIKCIQKDALILTYKGLHALAFKRLKRALELVEKYKLFELGGEIHLQISLLLVTHPSDYSKELPDHVEKAQYYGETQSIYYQLAIDRFHSFAKYNLENFNVDQPDNLFLEKNKDNPNIPENLSFHASLHYTFIRTLEAQANNNKPAVLSWQEATLDIFLKNEKYRKKFPLNYLAAISNFQNANYFNENWQIQLDILEQLEELDLKDPHLLALRAQRKLLIILNHWSNHPAVLAAVSDEEIEDLLSEFEDCAQKISFSSKLAIQHNFSIIFFMRKDYDRAKYWAENLSEQELKKMRPNAQRAALILGLLIAYDDPEIEQSLVATRIKSLRVYFNRNNQEPHEKIAIKHIRKLNNLPFGKGEKPILEEFATELELLAENSSEDQHHRTDFLLWWVNQKLQQ